MHWSPGHRVSSICMCIARRYQNDGVNVVNFTSSWKDGLALAAIINNNRPDLLDFKKMKELGKPKEIIKEAFRVAEEHLGVPHLVEVEDILIADDEKVIMAYVSEYFSLFSKQVAASDAIRRYLPRAMGLPLPAPPPNTHPPAHSMRGSAGGDLRL